MLLTKVCSDFDAQREPNSIKMCEFTRVVRCGILTIFFFFSAIQRLPEVENRDEMEVATDRLLHTSIPPNLRFLKEPFLFRVKNNLKI